ncbi:MAG: hypothetical protein HPY71_14555, partial [Firmicutes bacterium]|nr:hypothetical protein [Bacillota bacterium]
METMSPKWAMVGWVNSKKRQVQGITGRANVSAKATMESRTTMAAGRPALPMGSQERMEKSSNSSVITLAMN